MFYIDNDDRIWSPSSSKSKSVKLTEQLINSLAYANMNEKKDYYIEYMEAIGLARDIIAVADRESK